MDLIKIADFCEKHGITKDQFFGREKISGSLYLRSVTSIPEGFNPTVGSSLDLRSVTSIPEGFNPTVGSYLDLRSVTSIPEGFNPTVGGSLDLRSVTSIPEGFNPTVGSSLYLSSVTSIPEGFNPTVGGSLDLRSVTSIPEGFNPTVGGSLYLRSGLKAKTKSFPKDYVFSWQNGKYIMHDGILTEVLHKRAGVYKVRIYGKTQISWLVVNGNFSAHGETLQKAKKDLRFKIISEKLKNEPIKKDTIIDIKYYRLITGSCESGVNNFISQHSLKESYKASELLPILEKANAYGLEKFKKLLTF